MDASTRLDDTIATYAYARADETINASATSQDPLPIVLKASPGPTSRRWRAGPPTLLKDTSAIHRASLQGTEGPR